MNYDIKRYIFILFLLICPFFAMSESSDDFFYSLTVKELENFQKAYGDECNFAINNWSVENNDEFIDVSFDVNGKPFRVLSERNEDKYVKELRKFFSVELGSIVGESDISLFNVYKNAITIQGNVKIGDILFVNSLNNSIGTYIVSQKQKFLKQIGNEKKESTIFMIKPIKPVLLLSNARFTRNEKNLFLENSFFTTGVTDFKGTLISKIKTSIFFPLFLNGGLIYSYDTDETNTVGIQVGFEVMSALGSMQKIVNGLNAYAAFDFGVLYGFNNDRLSYSPSIELGARWFFKSNCAVSFGFRFTKEYYKEKTSSDNSSYNDEDSGSVDFGGYVEPDDSANNKSSFERSYSGFTLGFSIIL